MSLSPLSRQWRRFSSRPSRRILAAAWLGLLLCGPALSLLRAEEDENVSPAVIEDPAQFWRLSQEEKLQPHRVRLEFIVYYYDSSWNLLWGGWNGTGFYVPLKSGTRLPLKPGQHVLLEGTVIAQEGFSASTLKVTVLSEQAMPAPRVVAGNTFDRISDAEWIRVEGYVIRQIESDGTHVQYYMLVEGRRLGVRLLLGENEPVPQLLNTRVKLNAMYIATRDTSGNILRIDLWVPRRSEIQILGSIADDPRFKLPITPLDQLSIVPVKAPVHVAGEVVEQELGRTLTLRDNVGQISIATAQPDKLAIGERIELVGRVEPQGATTIRTITDPIYRHAVAAGVDKSEEASRNAPHEQLRLVSQVLELSDDEARRAYPVLLRGIVTWANPKQDYFFIQDNSGGVRVRYDRATAGEPPTTGQAVAVVGETRSGVFSPEVMLNGVGNTVGLAVPAPRRVTLDQALTGAEEGRLVEMRGYLHNIVNEGDWRRMDLTTSAGEFSAYAPREISLGYFVGAVVRITGVCAAETNAQRQLTGIRLWVADGEAIAVDEPRLENPFQLPSQTIASLRQFTGRQAFNRRVRVSGTVLAHVPGRYLYLQEGDTGLMVLSRETEKLAPGANVEAVGFLGREGSRLVLREAVWRSTRGGPPIVPLKIEQASRVQADADARLVRLRATLRQVVTQRDTLRLAVQADGYVFEALLPNAANFTVPDIGSRLELTGVYLLEFDEYRQPRGFRLELRSGADVVVAEAPPWWTASRALAVAGGLGLCALLAFAWGASLQRRVRKQTAQIREQLEKETRLQAELERSTRLESLGVLAGGIAHDFNNLLTAIMGNLGLIGLNSQAMTLVGDNVRDATRAAKRAGDVTQQLLTFAKGGNPVRASVHLPEVVREAAGFASHGAKIKIEFHFPPTLPPADVDVGQISRVVHNLVLNAAQAMPAGGLVRIALAAVHVDGVAIPGLMEGDYLKLSVSDGGKGIAAEQLPRIFDPYFSTKTGNSGLGLATVRSIVKKHDGHIAVESIVDQGTTFHLWLPVAKTLPIKPAPVDNLRPATGGTRVLFMDDEEVIRDFVGPVLRRAGHDVILVRDGAAAVRSYSEAQRNGRAFDVVILDLTVPGGMGGKDALEELRKIDPEVCAIASSGYSSDPIMANFRAYGFSAVVPKPYDLETLVQAIERVRRSEQVAV